MSMQRLIRSAAYPVGQRPDFAKAYAKAAYRYKFNVGIFPAYAFNPHTKQVVRVHSVDDIDGGTEVVADSLGGDMEYVVPVTVGTPGVTFQIDFDTGSSDFWVWGTKIPKVQGHQIYDPKKSSTYKPAAGKFEIHFGDGSWAKGIVCTDNTTIGDITIKDQVVEVATQVSPEFLRGDGNDGLLGLAWPGLNSVSPRPVATPVENMISQNLLAIPVFSCALGRGEDDGFYSFGYIDPDVTPHPLVYTPVDKSNGWWEVPSTSYTINGKKTNRAGNTCILDTGTTLTLVDDTVLSNIYGSIPGAVFDHAQGGWKYPVNARVPEIAFAVGNNLYKINPKDIPYGPADNDGFYFGGIQSRGDFDKDIFGDSFLKAVYAVFNQGEATVGLAQRDE